MGIYACEDCFREHGFEAHPTRFCSVGCCETCGELHDDWRRKAVQFTCDVTRNDVDPLDVQLARRARASAIQSRV